MEEVTVNGTTCWWCPWRPNWADRVSAEIEVPVVGVTRLTGRETTRARGETLRWVKVRGTWLLERAQWVSLRAGLRALGAAPVLMPLWPFAAPVEDTIAYGAGMTAYGPEASGTTAYGPRQPGDSPVRGGIEARLSASGALMELMLDGAPPTTAWQTGEMRVPVLWGRLVKRVAEAVTPDLVEVAWEFRETSPAAYAVRVASYSWATGPATGALQPPLFPARHNWVQVPDVSLGETVVTTKPLGDSRQEVVNYYDQIAQRRVELALSLDGWAEQARLMRFWMDHAAGRFWAPGLLAETTLAVGHDGGDVLMVASGEALGDYRHLWLSDGANVVVAEVVTVDGDELALAAATGLTLGAGETVATAMLARLAEDTLKLAWTAPGLAEATVGLIEVPDETTLPVGETRGVTIGEVPKRAWLYEIEETRWGVVTVHRVTSWERDIVWNGARWTAVPVEHIRLAQGLSLDQERLTLSLGWWESNPWASWLQGDVTASVRVRIRRGTPTTAGEMVGVTQVYDGEVLEVTATANLVKVQAGGNRLFARPAPAGLMQLGCNTQIYSEACGLLREAWTFVGVVAAISGTTLTIDEWDREGGLPGSWGQANYFAGGYLETTENGRLERVLIYGSTALASGVITLTLGQAVATAIGLDDSVVVVPGCDGRWGTCTGRYGNGERFRGFPFMPAKNPSFKPGQKQGGTGKK